MRISNLVIALTGFSLSAHFIYQRNQKISDMPLSKRVQELLFTSGMLSGDVPKSFINKAKNLYFTSAAIQGMRKHHVTQEEVEEVLNSHVIPIQKVSSHCNSGKTDTVCVCVYGGTEGVPSRVLSIWKEQGV